MIHSLFSSDYDLHDAVTETFHVCNRISEAFGDDHTNIAGGPGTAAQNGLKGSAFLPRLSTGQPGLLYRTQVDSSSLQCFHQLAPAARQRTHQG
ncbi:unnamed protein product [Heligmosomoides polygyrus]|uniref:Lyase_1 domain-containing protein n=1 Tax=Heligmosomoides polygyrus TaxID=6339 RepID=A0A183GCN8_HELPZ|nr:unnamed protein product [Heligmosomoides polygyrus]